MPATPPQTRREGVLRFGVDPSLQDRGGAQYFFTVLHPQPSPLQREPVRSLARMLPAGGKDWDPLHAMASRFVYTLEKDVTFFTAERADDLTYIRALMPEANVERLGDRFFRSHLLPASNFRVRFLGTPQLAQPEQGPLIKTFVAFAPELGVPTAIAIQVNEDFERVMAVRTAEISVTWTGYYRLERGRTRVVSYGLTLLHNTPPFFLGGDDRLHDSLLKEMVRLIHGMRTLRPPPPVLPVLVPLPPEAPADPRSGPDGGADRPDAGPGPGDAGR
ncbi:MAG: hypothetical protein M3Y59_17235 [Myxococcota bacterium]|nr:hypothetical protein [Myxococcota bacterium]